MTIPDDFPASGPVPVEAEATASPVVIIHRDQSSRGREFILAALLMLAVGVFAYREAGGRLELAASPPAPREGRLVSASNAAPIGQGRIEIVPVDRPEDGDPAGDESPEVPVEHGAPEAPPVATDRIDPVSDDPGPISEVVADGPDRPEGPPPDATAFDDPLEAIPDRASIGRLLVGGPMNDAGPEPEPGPIPTITGNPPSTDVDPNVPDRVMPAPLKPLVDVEPEAIPVRSEIEDRDLVESQRRRYQGALLQLLRRHGSGAGPHIGQLSRDFGGDPSTRDPRLEAVAARGFADLGRTVEELRHEGVPSTRSSHGSASSTSRRSGPVADPGTLRNAGSTRRGGCSPSRATTRGKAADPGPPVQEPTGPGHRRSIQATRSLTCRPGSGSNSSV